MKKFAGLFISFMLIGCQSLSTFQANNILQKYGNKLIKLEKSDNYFVKDVILYRVNGSNSTNLSFLYNSTQNHIKALLIDCSKQEAKEIGYYQVNEVSEKILAGYLPPDDPKVLLFKHQPPIEITVPQSQYTLVCQ